VLSKSHNQFWFMTRMHEQGNFPLRARKRDGLCLAGPNSQRWTEWNGATFGPRQSLAPLRKKKLLLAGSPPTAADDDAGRRNPISGRRPTRRWQTRRRPAVPPPRPSPTAAKHVHAIATVNPAADNLMVNRSSRGTTAKAQLPCSIPLAFLILIFLGLHKLEYRSLPSLSFSKRLGLGTSTVKMDRSWIDADVMSWRIALSGTHIDSAWYC
jgi:hypothetical protein